MPIAPTASKVLVQAEILVLKRPGPGSIHRPMLDMDVRSSFNDAVLQCNPLRIRLGVPLQRQGNAVVNTESGDIVITADPDVIKDIGQARPTLMHIAEFETSEAAVQFAQTVRKSLDEHQCTFSVDIIVADASSAEVSP